MALLQFSSKNEHEMSWSIRVNFDQGYRTNRIKSNWTSQKSPLRHFISFRRQRATKWPLFFSFHKMISAVLESNKNTWRIGGLLFHFFFGFHKIERRRRQGRTNCGPRQLLPVVNCCSDRTQVKTAHRQVTRFSSLYDSSIGCQPTKADNYR